jgi:hypothetical protein
MFSFGIVLLWKRRTDDDDDNIYIYLMQMMNWENYTKGYKYKLLTEDVVFYNIMFIVYLILHNVE